MAQRAKESQEAAVGQLKQQMGYSTADELAKLDVWREKGPSTDVEYQQLRSKVTSADRVAPMDGAGGSATRLPVGRTSRGRSRALASCRSRSSARSCRGRRSDQAIVTGLTDRDEPRAGLARAGVDPGRPRWSHRRKRTRASDTEAWGRGRRWRSTSPRSAPASRCSARFAARPTRAAPPGVDAHQRVLAHLDRDRGRDRSARCRRPRHASSGSGRTRLAGRRARRGRAGRAFGEYRRRHAAHLRRDLPPDESHVDAARRRSASASGSRRGSSLMGVGRAGDGRRGRAARGSGAPGQRGAVRVRSGTRSRSPASPVRVKLT